MLIFIGLRSSLHPDKFVYDVSNVMVYFNHNDYCSYHMFL